MEHPNDPVIKHFLGGVDSVTTEVNKSLTVDIKTEEATFKDGKTPAKLLKE